MRPPRRVRLAAAAAAAAALAAVALAAFGPALRGGFVWDDFGLIVGNAGIAGLDAARLRWMATTGYLTAWQPLGWLSWALLRAAFGESAPAFHAAALALHAACALALFLAARRLGQATGEARPGLAAFLAALLFCAHPLQAASAAWSTEIPDMAATLLFLAALSVYLGGRSRARLTACAALFASSLLFRWKCASLPVALALLDWRPLRRPLRGRASEAVWGEKIPFVALACLAAIPNAAAKAATGHRLGLQPLAAAQGAWLYLEKLLAPAGLRPGYVLGASGGGLAPAPLCAALLALLSALAWLQRARRPFLLASLLFYLAALAPALLVPRDGALRALPHHSYAACLPFFVLAGFGLARLRGARGPLLAAALVAAWLPLSRYYARVWSDGVLLWTRALTLQPADAVARVNLGDALGREGRFHDAWFFARAAAAADPSDVTAQVNLAAVEAAAPGQAHDRAALWAHMSADELRLGRVDDALALAGKALQAAPRSPEARAAFDAAKLLKRGVSHLF